ncbi:MAG TPA: hypothetical protein GXX28_05600 [Firmicutes bacterium]|nr:hypothetical protein [Bacillota bacterium]
MFKRLAVWWRRWHEALVFLAGVVTGAWLAVHGRRPDSPAGGVGPLPPQTDGRPVDGRPRPGTDRPRRPGF